LLHTVGADELMLPSQAVFDVYDRPVKIICAHVMPQMRT